MQCMRVCAYISKDAIRHNFNEIKKSLPEGVKVMPVIKADGYGHGALTIASMLKEEGVEVKSKKELHQERKELSARKAELKREKEQSKRAAKMAKKNNRNYIGFEISKEYCDIAEERLLNLMLDF